MAGKIQFRRKSSEKVDNCRKACYTMIKLELSESLLIDIDLAQKIVELRDTISYFSNDLELLYVDGFSKEMLVERRPYITW